MRRGNLGPVGRPRTKNKHLPRRVYEKHGAYYFLDRNNEWHRLASVDDYPGALKALAARLTSGAPIDNIEQLWAKYQVEELVRKAKKTQQNRRNDMKWPLKVFGPMRAGDIEPHHVWTFWRKRGQTEQARHEIRALSALLTFARQCGAMRNENPCFDLKLPGATPRTLYVTDEMFFAVRDIAPTMLGYAMDIALCGGLDESTIISLERRHVVPTGLEFERGKTKKPQLVEGEDLVTIVKAALGERPQLRRFVICRRDGKPYTANGFQTAWQRLMVNATSPGKNGEPPRLAERYHFHDLRAKSGSDAASDKEAAERLGHADEDVTRRHYRRLPQRSKALRILDKRGEY